MALSEQTLDARVKSGTNELSRDGYALTVVWDSENGMIFSIFRLRFIKTNVLSVICSLITYPLISIIILGHFYLEREYRMHKTNRFIFM